MADYPFIIIEFPEYDVAVPLICRLCGNCCRKYYVPVELETLPEIARIMGEPIYTIQDRLNESLESCRQGNPRDCCFLSDSRCIIHNVKPEACRQFPSFTDAGAGDANCPAHKEHKRIERALCRENDEIQIRLPSSVKKTRAVPDSEWEMILGMAERADLSELFLQAFITLNKTD